DELMRLGGHFAELARSQFMAGGTAEKRPEHVRSQPGGNQRARAVAASTSRGGGGRAADHPPPTAFGLGFCGRLVNLALLTGRDAFFAEQDAFAYWALGAALAKPHAFWPTLLSLTDRMPLYPLLLAGVQHAFGDVPRAVALIQAVIDAGTCALIAA